ncbi:NAD+ kinase [Synchytrium microbalum]|uniref:NAD+ kinase n=1 Tax=Synchytrium microbalum TaxID=1806994 RepID=A0A507CHC5_9FUNG|nr:NAD+ kinase [Synchytrium microbalum]TPX37075.1 NAD+ kinase [Synchytrium microbalum]
MPADIIQSESTGLQVKLYHATRIALSLLDGDLTISRAKRAFEKAFGFGEWDELTTIEFLDSDGDYVELPDDPKLLMEIEKRARAGRNRLSLRTTILDIMKSESIDCVSSIASASVKLMDMTTKLSRLQLKLNVRNILVVTKPFDPALVPLTRDLAVWLVETYPVEVYVQEPLRTAEGFDYDEICSQSDKVKSRLKFWGREFIRNRADDVNLAITLGGDGTVLYSSWLFQKQSPPVMPFYLGSLGFLTVFDFGTHREALSRVLEGQGQRVNLRMRLQCAVYSKPRSPTPKPENRQLHPIPRGALPKHNTFTRDAVIRADPEECEECDIGPVGPPSSVHQVMNEMVVDRGASPSMLQLELYADDLHLTTILADGLLSAGGSLVHPEKASILVTPICPHTLTCRPMILPGQTELRVCVTLGSRSVAWASFDGRYRRELLPGDSICITASRYPFVSLCNEDQSSDWFRSLISTLHWNERPRQKPLDRTAMM